MSRRVVESSCACNVHLVRENLTWVAGTDSCPPLFDSSEHQRGGGGRGKNDSFLHEVSFKTISTSTKYIHIKSTTVYCMSPRRNGDSPIPSFASEYAPPPGTKGGGGELACGWGVGGVPIPTTWEKLSTLPTLCLHPLPANIGGTTTCLYILWLLLLSCVRTVWNKTRMWV